MRKPTFVMARKTRLALDTNFSMGRPSSLVPASTVMDCITTRSRSHKTVSLRSNGSRSPLLPSLRTPAASESESEVRSMPKEPSELRPS